MSGFNSYTQYLKNRTDLRFFIERRVIVDDLSAEVATLTIVDASTVEDVNTNTANIASNTASIASIITDVSTNKINIAANAGYVTSIPTDVSTNKVDISSNAIAIPTIIADISVNIIDISSNTARIPPIIADVSTNKIDISTNMVALNTIIADVSTNKINIASIIADVSTNKIDISNNANDISVSVIPLIPDISVNKIDISNNTGNTAINVADISSNNSRIADMESKFLYAYKTVNQILDLSNTLYSITFPVVEFVDSDFYTTTNIGVSGEFIPTHDGTYLITIQVTCDRLSAQSGQISIRLFRNGLPISNSEMALITQNPTELNSGTSTILTDISGGDILGYIATKTAAGNTALNAHACRLLVEKVY
jgi:hypothetical protein